MSPTLSTVDHTHCSGSTLRVATCKPTDESGLHAPHSNFGSKASAAGASSPSPPHATERDLALKPAVRVGVGVSSDNLAELVALELSGDLARPPLRPRETRGRRLLRPRRAESGLRRE